MTDDPMELVVLVKLYRSTDPLANAMASAIETLVKERDETLEEIETWKSVFPDIAPRLVLPDSPYRMGREAGIREALALIDGVGYDRVRTTKWRDDGKPSKNDKCPHGVVMYEDCEACLRAAILALIKPQE